MPQQQLFIHSVISTILMIIAVGVLVCKADAKKNVHFVFVVERSPMAGQILYEKWEDTIYKAIFDKIRRWVEWLSVCIEESDRVKHNVMASYTGFILDINEDELEEPAPFTFSGKKMRDSYLDKIYSMHSETKLDPNRQQKTAAAIKKVRNAITRPVEWQGAPVILLWHVPFPWQMEPISAMLKLTKNINGPEVVFAFESLNRKGVGRHFMYKCIDCREPELVLYYDYAPSCSRMQPHVNPILDLLWKCKTEATYSNCYYDSALKCVVDVAYVLSPDTSQEYVKYCTFEKNYTRKCGDGERTCKVHCDRIMKTSACSVTCGQGIMKQQPPPGDDKFTRYCPEGVLPCDEPPCPGQTPATRRRVTTTVGTVSTLSKTPDANLTSTTSVPGGILKPWMIAVMAVCAVALLAIIIGVVVFCVRKGEKSPAPGASYWSRFYTRRTAPRRHHAVARSPARTHGRQSPRYHSRPRSPSPTHHRPHAPSRPAETHNRPAHAPSRPVHAHNRPAQTYTRPAYASTAPVAPIGQRPRYLF